MAAAGDKIGGFYLVRQLGAGGMGETWEAIRRGDHGFEQRVAIKLAAPQVLKNPEGLELFRREASLAASLRHPNIASALDVDERQGYLIYELVEGADLRTVMREIPGRIPTPLLVYVLAQIARALSHAHKRVLHGRPSPVVHRDMSPGNVVVDYDGNLKIVDFGIAKATAVGERSETIKGKLSYMAPEQVMGSDMDGRVDQYALGVMAYEAVTGVRPNDGAHDGETLGKILHGQHVPVTKRAPDIPAGLGEIIERMLSQRPEDRFPSMDAVIDALSAFTPPLTIHRELGELVRKSNPPETILLQGEKFVSVPIAQQAAAGAARSLHSRTIAGPAGASTPTPGSTSAPAVMPPTETFGYKGESSDLGSAATEVAPARESLAAGAHRPGAGVLPAPRLLEPASASVTLPRRPAWHLPATLGAVAAVLGMVAWAMFSGSGETAGPAVAASAVVSAAPGTDGANPRPSVSATPSSAAAPEAQALAGVETGAHDPMPTATPTTNALPPSDPPPTSAPSAADSNADKPTPAAERSSARSPRSARKPKPSPRPPEPQESASTAATAPEPRARGATARVRVKVFPWGRVWIDGKVRGSVPPILEATLSAGTHEIAVGHEQPMQKRKVSLTAGEDQLVSFDLEER